MAQLRDKKGKEIKYEQVEFSGKQNAVSLQYPISTIKIKVCRKKEGKVFRDKINDYPIIFLYYIESVFNNFVR